MISDKVGMFPIEFQFVLPEEGLPFPVFLFLPINRKYIPVRLTGDPIGKEKFDFFANKSVNQFWIPDSFRPQYEEYLKKFQKPKEEPKPMPAPVIAPPAEDGVFEETEIIAEVMQDEELSREAKAEILASLGQDLLRAFNQISNRGAEGQREAIKRGRQITDEILAIASQNSNIYDEILALRQSKQDIEHSIMVSTLGVMFGLALGYTDEILLADLATAGLFHDIGLTKVNPMVLAKPENRWSAMDRMQYNEHVGASTFILKNAKAPYNDIVFRMINEHHENYDGSGFPNQLKGLQVAEVSQLVHLANWFDRLTAGKLDGVPLAPNESFDRIFQLTLDPKAVREIQPELIQKVFQFMLEEKEAAENLLHEANSRAKFVSDDKLRAS